MGHSHHHHHIPAEGGSKSLMKAFWLNFTFTLIEFAGGFWTNSTAIFADALHDLGDSVALGLAWYLGRVSQREKDKNFSYGYKRFSTLGAVINSMILIAGGAVILSQAIPRVLDPQPVHAPGMLGLAVLGIFVNGLAAYQLSGTKSLNERVVSLHLLEDVLGWVAVLVVAGVLLFADLPVLDPLLSIAITLYVGYNAVKNLISAGRIMLQATPSELDLEKLKEKVLQVPDIISQHDMHLWTLDGENHILTLHVVISKESKMEQAEAVKHQLRSILQGVPVYHLTVEVERENENCDLKPE